MNARQVLCLVPSGAFTPRASRGHSLCERRFHRDISLAIQTNSAQIAFKLLSVQKQMLRLALADGHSWCRWGVQRAGRGERPRRFLPAQHPQSGSSPPPSVQQRRESIQRTRNVVKKTLLVSISSLAHARRWAVRAPGTSMWQPTEPQLARSFSECILT